MATPHEALEAFTSEVKNEYVTWYQRHETICRVVYLSLQLLVFLISIASAIVAALSDPEQFASWGKFVLVALPLATTVCTTLLTQAHVYDMWKLREQGRIEVQRIVFESAQLAAGATSDAARKIHHEMIERLMKIESVQSASFFGFFKSDFVLQVPAKAPTTPDTN